MLLAADRPVSTEIIIKVAAYCNLNCTYCHWFRDPEVLRQSKVMPEGVFSLVVERLENHIRARGLRRVDLILHGGEPTLVGKKRMIRMAESFQALAAMTGCTVSLGIQTNAFMVDKEWAEIFRNYDIRPSVSVDGPKEIHDRYRVDRREQGSFDRVMAGIANLREAGIEPGFLAVMNPEAEPALFYNFFAEELRAKFVDVLIPNFDHEDRRKNLLPAIAGFYKELFDLWFAGYARQPMTIRLFDKIIKILIDPTPKRGIYEIMNNLIISPDGNLEPHDVLRISGHDKVFTGTHVLRNEIADIEQTPVWQRVYDASRKLPTACQQCPVRNVCNGGYLMHRFKDQSYDHPSVYCQDMLELIPHIEQTIHRSLYLRSANASYR